MFDLCGNWPDDIEATISPRLFGAIARIKRLWEETANIYRYDSLTRSAVKVKYDKTPIELDRKSRKATEQKIVLWALLGGHGNISTYFEVLQMTKQAISWQLSQQTINAV